jgi:acetyl/propionyl-CoA carboxylase alpha subunit
MYQIKSGDNTFSIKPSSSNSGKGLLDEKEYELDLVKEENGFHLIKDHKSYEVSVVKADFEDKNFEIVINGHSYQLEAQDQFDLLLKELGMENLNASAINNLKAPMPGLVLSIEVEEGQEIKKGDPLVVLEAMKMENVLKAAQDATVKSISAKKGAAVEKNQMLIEFS